MINVAIVGCGTMGRIYAENLLRMEGVRLVAASDYKPESANAFAALYRTQGYSSMEDMIASADPDVVCITLPTFVHKEYVLRVAATGKHIICEKPIALNAADAADMIAACESAGVRLLIGHVLHFLPEYRDIRDTVSRGKIGAIGVAHTKRSGPHPGLPGNWYNDPHKSGGVIMDLMIHDIEFVRSLIGEVQTVYACNKQAEGIDYANVTLQFAGGATANLESCWGYPSPFVSSAEFAGDGGVVRYHSLESHGIAYMRPPAKQKDAGRVVVPRKLTAYDPVYFELEHFLDCIARRAEPIVTARDALAAVEIVQAAVRSSRTGLPVRLQHDPSETNAGGRR